MIPQNPPHNTAVLEHKLHELLELEHELIVAYTKTGLPRDRDRRDLVHQEIEQILKQPREYAQHN